MDGHYSTANPEKLSLQECLDLGRRCAEGDLKAREELILSHMYLVDRELFPLRNKGVDTEDLFQSGCYGLIKAVDKYDYTRGVLFSTYAVYWIRKEMFKALRVQNIDRPIILNDNEYWIFMKMCAFITKQLQELGSRPTSDEIANELRITPEKATKLLKFSEPFINIDTSTNPGTSAWSGRSAEEMFFDKLLSLEGADLTKRERTVLARHLGLVEPYMEESYKEIAADLNVSCETVRLDYRSALEKIKTKFTNKT